jgi:hypothetical protein
MRRILSVAIGARHCYQFTHRNRVVINVCSSHYSIIFGIKMASLLSREGDQKASMMDWNEDAVRAAQTTLNRVNNAIDAITIKATQLESLLVLLAHTAKSEVFPAQHHENVCWLGSELAAEIRQAAGELI